MIDPTYYPHMHLSTDSAPLNLSTGLRVRVRRFHKVRILYASHVFAWYRRGSTWMRMERAHHRIRFGDLLAPEQPDDFDPRKKGT